MIRLILASQSPHRLTLLRGAGYDVEARPAFIREPALDGVPDLTAALEQIARLKARSSEAQGAQGLIFAADTVGRVADRVFGKPRDRNEARQMLEAISGTTHDVLTGWCLLRTSDAQMRSGTETTQIEMRGWSDAELEHYLDSGAWRGKSGAYGLQWPVDPFVVRMQGSASSVVGVPLERLAEVLAELGCENRMR